MLPILRRITTTTTDKLNLRQFSILPKPLNPNYKSHQTKPLTKTQLKALVSNHYSNGKFSNLIQNVVALPSVLLAASQNLTPDSPESPKSSLFDSLPSTSPLSSWVVNLLRKGSILIHVVSKLGRVMVKRTWERAKLATTLDHVVVATDDERIARCCQEFGANVIMTSESCRNGAERCSGALEKLEKKYDIVVNFQGDEPLVE